MLLWDFFVLFLVVYTCTAATVVLCCVVYTRIITKTHKHTLTHSLTLNLYARESASQTNLHIRFVCVFKMTLLKANAFVYDGEHVFFVCLCFFSFFSFSLSVWVFCMSVDARLSLYSCYCRQYQWRLRRQRWWLRQHCSLLLYTMHCECACACATVSTNENHIIVCTHQRSNTNKSQLQRKLSSNSNNNKPLNAFKNRVCVYVHSIYGRWIACSTCIIMSRVQSSTLQQLLLSIKVKTSEIQTRFACFALLLFLLFPFEIGNDGHANCQFVFARSHVSVIKWYTQFAGV